jgi:4-amino-4-deoxy-L-arabinose transferase-like glycosyltransferase
VNRDRVVSSVLLIAGLVFAFLGQLYFTYRREFWRDGALFWGVSLFLFWLLWRRLRRRELKPRTRDDRHGLSRALSWAMRNPWRMLAFSGGMGLSLLAGWQARKLPAGSSFAGVFWMWVVGVVWFLMAFVPAAPVRRALANLGRRLYRHRLELAGLAVLLLVALLVRVVDLENIPVNLGGDEAAWGLEALAMLDGKLENPFATRWFGLPSLPFLFLGLSMKVFGASVAGLRMLSVFTGTAAVLTTFLLARELWGQRVALFAAALLAFGHYHLHFSRLAFNCVTDSLFATLTLFLVVRGTRSRRVIHFALAGAVMGLAVYEYYGARLINVIAVIYLFWQGVMDRRLRWTYWRLLMVSLGVTLVVAAPILFYYLENPSLFSEGWGRVSILSLDWFTKEQAYSGLGAAALLWRQFWKSISAFHYTLDPTFHYRSSIPLLDFVSGVLFFLGFVRAAVRWRRRGSGLVLVWFWAAVTMGWVLTENPPSSHRMLVVAPVLAILVGLGLNWLVELGQRVVGRPRFVGWDEIAIVALVLIAILNLHYYFIVYTPTGIYGNPTAEIATRLGRYLQEQGGTDDVVYFYGAPAMYAGIPNLRYLARDFELVDVIEGQEPTASIPASSGVRFVFLPHRLGELDAVRERFPDGKEKQAHSRSDDRLLYVLYEVEPR